MRTLKQQSTTTAAAASVVLASPTPSQACALCQQLVPLDELAVHTDSCFQRMQRQYQSQTPNHHQAHAHINSIKTESDSIFDGRASESERERKRARYDIDAAAAMPSCAAVKRDIKMEPSARKVVTATCVDLVPSPPTSASFPSALHAKDEKPPTIAMTSHRAVAASHNHPLDGSSKAAIKMEGSTYVPSSKTPALAAVHGGLSSSAAAPTSASTSSPTSIRPSSPHAWDSTDVTKWHTSDEGIKALLRFNHAYEQIAIILSHCMPNNGTHEVQESMNVDEVGHPAAATSPSAASSSSSSSVLPPALLDLFHDLRSSHDATVAALTSHLTHLRRQLSA